MPLVRSDASTDRRALGRRGSLGWLSIGLALLAAVGFLEPNVFAIAAAASLGAAVVGFLGVARWSAPVPALIGFLAGCFEFYVAIVALWIAAMFEGL